MASIFLLKNKKAMVKHDFYSEAVVVANTMEEALLMHPNDRDIWYEDCFVPKGTTEPTWDSQQGFSTWNEPSKIKITCIGTASGIINIGVISACFNAG